MEEMSELELNNQGFNKSVFQTIESAEIALERIKKHVAKGAFI